MSRLDRSPLLFKILLGFSTAFLLNGCASEKLVATPPVFSLYGYQRLAVVPFDNHTQDSALAGAVADEMTGEVVNVNALPVIQAGQVAAFLKSNHASASDLLTNDKLRKKLGQKFQCDVLLMGSADGYNEFLKDKAPERVVDDQTGEGKWGFYTNRKVVVNASAKLVDVNTGSLLWTEKNQGYSWYNTWNPLPIPGAIQVPDQLAQFVNLADLVKKRITHEGDNEPATIDQNDPNVLIYPKSQYFAELRQKAVFQTVNGIVEDFRPHGGWMPQLKGTNQ
jgi:TolB-like protein